MVLGELLGRAPLTLFLRRQFAQRCGFMTSKPNALVAPIHEKAMPVILTTQEEIETWMTAAWSEAKALQRTTPDDALVIADKPATQIKFPQQAQAQGSML